MRLLFFLTIVVLFECSHTEVKSQSSGSVNFYATAAHGTEEPMVYEPTGSKSNDSLYSEINDALDQLEIKAAERSRYGLTSDFNGYESNNSIVYYFDSLYILTYCTVNWSMEGSSGSATYYFDNEKLIAGREQNLNMNLDEEIIFHSSFQPVCGFTTTSAPDSDPEMSSIAQSQIDTKHSELMTDFKGILDTIGQNYDSLDVTDYSISLHLENNESTGTEFTTTQDYTIDKELYDHLVKN